ncbi:MAG: flagellar filament capping protein FliD [Spirochaetales bacterium]|nr:flagellar filament capping protein FliD [Spirochaetales bacterium]
MSDLSIPGVTGKYDTEKIIKALMDVKRVALDKMKDDVKEYNDLKSAWQDINRKLSTLKESTKNLYSFQNPFNEKIAVSSDEGVLLASATREAAEADREIIVRQLASADRFISGSLDRKFQVDAGTYLFKVGEKEVQIKFAGGGLKEFADTINKKSGGLLEAEVINDTKDTQVIIIQGGKTGSKNRIEFIGKSLEFGLKTGMLKEAEDKGTTISLTSIQPETWEKPLENNLFAIKDNILTLLPQAELKIPISPAVSLNENMVLELNINIKELSETDAVKILPPPGPDYPDAGTITFEGITIENEKSKVILPEWEAPPPPERIDDMNILFLGSKDKIIQLPAIDSNKQDQTIRIPIGNLAESVSSLYFRNQNTHREISITHLRIFDPTVRGDYKPVNPIAEAGDSIIIMDGITIIRDTNEIDDVIPGVTLSLQSEDTHKVDLKVKRDIDTIAESLVTFVGNYNQVITNIDILSRNNEDVIESISYFTDEEREKAKEQLGMLQGDIMLMQLRRSLQTIMMNPYKTHGDSNLRLLAQIGISSNAGQPGTSGGIDKTRLRGYLQIDEKKLEESLIKHADWVKDLFGMDTDGDFIIDSGLAYTMDSTIKPYTDTGGLISSRTNTFDTRIKAKEKDIEEYNDYLEDYEASLKKKYVTMEGLLEQLEKSSKALDNINSNNNK